MPMKIDIVCPQFLPSVGGIQIDVYNIARRLVERGDRVTVLTSNLVGNSPQKLPAAETIEGIAVKRFPVLPTSPFPLLTLTPTILKSLARRTPDVVHVLSFLPYFLTNAAIVFSKLRRIPLVVTPVFHPNRRKTYNTAIGKLVDVLFDRWLGLKLLRLADCVIAQTKAELCYYRQRGLKNVVQVPIGVDLEKHRCSPEQARRFAEDHHLFGGVVLFLGRMERRKGVDTLLRALPQVAREFPNVRLLVVGDMLAQHKEYRELARSLDVEERTVSVGRVPFSEISAALEAATVVVVPSLYEVTSRVVLEAWAHMKPVVASRNIGYAEIISEETGILTDYGDPVALAAAINHLLADSSQADAKGAAGFRLLQKGFLWDSIVSRTRDVYQETIERHRAKRDGRCETVTEYNYEQRLFGNQDIDWGDYRLRYCLEHLDQERGKALLDVGCGGGARTSLISQARPGLRCLGLEFSERSVLASPHIHGSLAFVRGDAQALPVRDAALDYLVAFDLFEHLQAPERVFFECHRALKPGGVLHVFIPCEGERLTIYPWVWPIRYLKRKKVGHVQAFTKKEIRESLQRIGFEVVGEKHSYFYISQLGDALRQLTKMVKCEYTQSGFQLSRIRSRPLAALVRTYRAIVRVASRVDLALCWLAPRCTAGYHVTAKRVR